ncbi:MAG: hypothetical protein OXG43_13170 [Chloroflexi bacterium]|nr:hypothetical protein [Chloroflexota bacterium]
MPVKAQKQSMDVKQAVGQAKNYVARVFGDEDIGSISLEEVEFDYDADVWKITVSFTRPSDRYDPIEAVLPNHPLSGGKKVRWSYKTVNINDNSGAVISVKHRELIGAD